MKAPACVRCKWGTGTTCEKQPDSVAAKEVKSQFEKMMAERTKQDAAWFLPPVIEEKKEIQLIKK